MTRTQVMIQPTVASLLTYLSCIASGLFLAQPIQADEPQMQELQIEASAKWRLLKSSEESKLWYEEPQNFYILQTNKGARAVPMDDIDKFRAFAREHAKLIQGGLIEANYLQLDGRKVGYMIIKNAYKDLTGFRYIGRCMIPVTGGWYEVRMDALPFGTTGKREAFLNAKLGLYDNLTMEPIPAEAPPTPGNPNREPGDERIKGIFKDPYDSKYDAAANYSITDDAKYDAQFPQHPLSRVRDRLPTVIESVVIKGEFAVRP